jgi:hypothetical protein
MPKLATWLALRIAGAMMFGAMTSVAAFTDVAAFTNTSRFLSLPKSPHGSCFAICFSAEAYVRLGEILYFFRMKVHYE